MLSLHLTSVSSHDLQAQVTSNNQVSPAQVNLKFLYLHYITILTLLQQREAIPPVLLIRFETIYKFKTKQEGGSFPICEIRFGKPVGAKGSFLLKIPLLPRIEKKCVIASGGHWLLYLALVVSEANQIEN